MCFEEILLDTVLLQAIAATHLVELPEAFHICLSEAKASRIKVRAHPTHPRIAFQFCWGCISAWHVQGDKTRKGNLWCTWSKKHEYMEMRKALDGRSFHRRLVYPRRLRTCTMSRCLVCVVIILKQNIQHHQCFYSLYFSIIFICSFEFLERITESSFQLPGKRISCPL